MTQKSSKQKLDCAKAEKLSRIIMTSPIQESESFHIPSTFDPSTLQGSTVQLSSERFRLDTEEASPEKRSRGRPKGSVKKRPMLEDGGSIRDLPKRPRGRPRKLEIVNTPKRPRGRPRKTADTESLPIRERQPSSQADISMISPEEPMIGAAASTSEQSPEFRKSSSTFRPIQNFSLSHDNAVGRWDVEQLVLNVSRAPDYQLTVKGSIRLSFRAQDLSREEHENLGQILKAPPLQDGERINISFTGQATSQ